MYNSVKSLKNKFETGQASNAEGTPYRATGIESDEGLQQNHLLRTGINHQFVTMRNAPQQRLRTQATSASNSAAMTRTNSDSDFALALQLQELELGQAAPVQHVQDAAQLSKLLVFK